jgi:aromatic ring-opening dioxygenase catalytic subunit (LigB family)
MDYYNFDPELYKAKFSSRGDATLSRRVVQLFQNVLLPLRLHSLFPGKILTIFL